MPGSLPFDTNGGTAENGHDEAGNITKVEGHNQVSLRSRVVTRIIKLSIARVIVMLST